MDPSKYVDHLVRRGMTPKEARRKIHVWLDRGRVYLDGKMKIRVCKVGASAPMWP